ncbi:acyl-CoA carboxylase subunit epsilon [Corynebacterium qintianiae]|uniref:Acyl-CoA carboxylase subunit epsilon n=1 Tax=Corynebacterium qintianiae TaxID=2709392 RepID=A0A7T0PG40_9CORY|nr:acyl-CoA carboxylase subunit epsilon [Corynebacterium qintianiae]QPK83652.1 acyl-CoA carboxylase subunit epsilon [Corynebacterium qintianiae]
MDIKVVKGNPTEDEIAALTMVLADLQAAAAATRTPGERNLWGTPNAPGHSAPIFNPGAFSNVTYF